MKKNIKNKAIMLSAITLCAVIVLLLMFSHSHSTDVSESLVDSKSFMGSSKLNSTDEADKEDKPWNLIVVINQTTLQSVCYRCKSGCLNRTISPDILLIDTIELIC